MLTSRSLLRVMSKCALLGVLSMSLAATSAANAAPRPAPRVFKVGSRSLEGRPKQICVIAGKWADGEPFRYETWDACSEMHVRAVTEAEYKDAPSLGSDDQYSVADIPRGSEVLEISNGFSAALIFRDRDGVQREILSKD